MNIGFKQVFSYKNADGKKVRVNTFFKEKIFSCLYNYSPNWVFRNPDKKVESPLKAEDVTSFKPKIHTVREDSLCRWRDHRGIGFCYGVRTKFFCKFLIGMCTGVQAVEIIRDFEAFSHYQHDPITGGVTKPITILHPIAVKVDGKLLSEEMLVRFVINDGFDNLEDFKGWFSKDNIKDFNGHFKGKLIHWTKFRY